MELHESAIPLYSSIAQSVEHAAVNRGVVGSSPTGGARKLANATASASFFSLKIICVCAANIDVIGTVAFHASSQS